MTWGVTVLAKCSDCAGIRTQDLAVKSRLLYQLSYATMVVKLGEKGALRKGSDYREVRATPMRRRFASNNQVVKPAESAIFAGNDIWSST